MCVFLQEALQSVKMANTVASYDQLAHQVEALRKENSHLRRELEDNSNHLSKLETETFGMKVSGDRSTSSRPAAAGSTRELHINDGCS